jgi:hypothetical protein
MNCFTTVKTEVLGLNTAFLAIQGWLDETTNISANPLIKREENDMPETPRCTAKQEKDTVTLCVELAGPLLFRVGTGFYGYTA